MIETLIIKANDTYIHQIMTLLDTFPHDTIEVIHKAKKTDKKPNAFGILKGRISDPVQWQREQREESDRDIYSDNV